MEVPDAHSRVRATPRRFGAGSRATVGQGREPGANSSGAGRAAGLCFPVGWGPQTGRLVLLQVSSGDPCGLRRPAGGRGAESPTHLLSAPTDVPWRESEPTLSGRKSSPMPAASSSRGLGGAQASSPLPRGRAMPTRGHASAHLPTHRRGSYHSCLAQTSDVMG